MDAQPTRRLSQFNFRSRRTTMRRLWLPDCHPAGAIRDLPRSGMALVLAFSWTIALLGLLLSAIPRPQVARAAGSILYVAPGGACGGASPCYAGLQPAIDAATADDEIRVAAGTYTGTQTIVTTPGFTYTQVALITKSLILRGGYATSNWITPNLTANPAVIDAERNGRGISIVGAGSQSVTVEGFTITGGDYTGLGNPPGVAFQGCVRTGSDCGGGLFAYNATVIIRNNVITDNIASRTTAFSDGGGIYLWSLRDGSRVEGITVISNSAPSAGGEGGGGMIEFGASVVISQSRFVGNYASAEGGGLFIFQPDGAVVIEATDFLSNTADFGNGGAMEARLIFNGIALRTNRARLQGNNAQGQGAAINLIQQGSDPVKIELTNALMSINNLDSPGSYGSVINASAGSFGSLDLSMAHLTFAANPAPAALRLAADLGRPVTAMLTNTLIVSMSNAFVGSQVSGTVQIRHTNTLTWNVTALETVEAGSPTFQAVNPLSGDPKLDATYHLLAGSAAIDAGVDAGVTTDIDGEPRPGTPDIGADEFIVKVYLPVVMRNN